MSSITVFTSITASKDNLIEDQCKGNAKFVAFTDRPIESKTWEVRPVYDRFKSDRRNSRIVKMLPHLYCDTEYSIWIDGSSRLLITPEEIVERFLKEHDIGLFKHPSRDCLYDEAIVCAKWKLDDPEVIIEQVKTYEDKGFAKHKGLCECGFIVRRHTPEVEAFNNAWWAEYCRYSCRDQISFMHAIDSVGIRINAIKIGWTTENLPDGKQRQFKGNVIEMMQHLTDRPEPSYKSFKN